MIVFHTANTPNGHKVAIALQELGMPHEVVPVDLGKGEQHLPEFIALSPNNKIPVIVDRRDDGSGEEVVFESCAILIHLADKAGRLLSGDPVRRSETLQWLFLQTSSIGPMLGQLWWFRHGTSTRNEQALERYTREARRLYGVIERRLAAHPYIAGDAYSIADIAMFPWLRTTEELGLDVAEWPHVQAWLSKVGERPAVQRGLALLQPQMA
ncbi:MAG: glutathione S-transferase N-terminal domain-containing protein [Burkholderiaceae bacterium]|jgi:GST-like protein|nr:glutathione S-transferase N-terminal domain-containing protein [Burkholderiaceae bacterium]